ncbi:site-specific integrase [Paenibacillus chondroitinus]|uniref:Site-specific integrase n=1 Tax=Paenibacillus chondroitinus TaxID=59842 RepID=A0ABU6DGL5_9BACL|nr:MULTISPECIES: site-specific integrase [Paenibacillus]MCY9659510.1 site-specific integrase [Paenibacillus anseongense]MEB4796905.1 site-specific integrase [Paenibacillus chondroitinus]
MKDAKGNFYFDVVNEDLLEYYMKNIVNFPWANHMALNMIVATSKRLAPSSIRVESKSVSLRLKDLFNHYALKNMNEFKPDLHMYDYLKGQIYTEHSLNQRAKFLKCYFTISYRTEKWMQSKLNLDHAAMFKAFVLPKPSFDTRDFTLMKQVEYNAQQNRKLETSAITPLLPQIRAEGNLRRNQLLRLRNKVREVLTAAKENNWPLPIAFDYEESEAIGERFFFKLWDKPSFVLAHREQYSSHSIQAATKKTGAYSNKQNECFVEFVKSKRTDDSSNGEGLWFSDLMKEDVLGFWTQNKSKEEIYKRLSYLNQWGYGTEENKTYPVPFWTGHKGVLGQSTFIAKAQSKAEGIIFNVEPFYVASIFALFALILFTGSGIRLNELLQIAQAKECLVVAEDKNHQPPRKNYIFRLIPKGRDEPENYYVTEDVFKLMAEILQLLREQYGSKTIPLVSYEYRVRKHMFGQDKYLMQYSGRHFDSDVIHTILRFLFHGIVIQTDEGGQVSVKPHLLRHAFATHAVQTEKLPIDVVKEILHQKDVQVTGYYSQPTHGQIGQAINDLHDNWVSHIDIQQDILRCPEELQEFYDEYREKVGTMSKVAGGICTTDAVCPTKMACIGCAAKVPRPEFKRDIEEFHKWASESEARFKKLNLPLEVQKMKIAKNRARNELKEIALIENYQKDASHDPIVRIHRPQE